MFDRFKTLFQRKPALSGLYEQFVSDFLDECSRQGRKPSSYDPQARTFAFDDGRKITVYLDNIFKLWCTSAEPARAQRLASFVRAFVEPAAEPPRADSSQLPSEVMPAVRHRSFISHLLIEDRMQPERELAFTPLCGGLAACVCQDLPDRMHLLKRSDLVAAQLPYEQAMVLAMAHLRSKAPAPEFEPIEGVSGAFGCVNLEDYQSSLLLLKPGEDFAFPQLDGDPVALVPGRNSFLVTGSGNLPGLRLLLQMAGYARERIPNFLSSGLWVWRDGDWREYRFDAGTEEAAKQQRLARDELASDYQQQKARLDELHSSQGEDIFVASIMVVRDDHSGSESTVTTLASGTQGSLLPVADRIAFGRQIIDPATGIASGQPAEWVQVAWPDAMAIAGHLFEPVPGLYPARYRARGFPDAGTWSALLRLKGAASGR